MSMSLKERTNAVIVYQMIMAADDEKEGVR